MTNELPQRTKRGVRLARTVAKRGSRTLNGRLQELKVGEEFGPRAADDFVAAAYFGSDIDSVYQLEQWLWPMEQLAAKLREDGYGQQPFGILTRDIAAARRLREVTEIPVRFSRLTSGVDEFMNSDRLRVVFYVNQATGNFQGLRYPGPAHVHLSHGESEKISMISNQLKAYDYVFTAGEAARERIGRTLVGLTPERLLDVGRPQLDCPRQIPQSWHEFDTHAPAGTTVFYAPTWEGDSPSMAYGTLVDNGTMLVSSMLDAGFRVIFRPHPRTGVRDRSFKKALDEVCSMIDANPRGFLDSTTDVSWQFDAADRALIEMSSVAFDWLATRKPLVMIKSCHSDSIVPPGGLLDRTATIGKGSEDTLIRLLTDPKNPAESAGPLCEHYLGATGPGDQIGRFLSASEQVIAERERNLSGSS